MTTHPITPTFLAALLIASSCQLSPRADAADEDFKSSTFSFTVYRYTDATKAALEAQGEKRVVRVDIGEQCSMSDLAKVCDHAWIEKLKFADGAPLITSIEPLAKLTALEELDAARLTASKEAAIDLAPLAGLENLAKLFLGGTKATNFAALTGMTKLEALDLRMTGVDSLKFLSSCPNIERLDLYGKDNTFPNYDALAGLKNLESLVIDGNAQATDQNLAALGSLTKLENISMNDCSKVTSLSFLKGSASNLENLKMTDCESLTDTALLAEMTSLEGLLARAMPTQNVSFLPKLTKLRTLNLQKIKVTDLSAFAGLADLKTVHLTKEMLPLGAEEQLAKMLPKAKFYIK